MGSRNALPENFLQVLDMLGAGRFPVEEAVTAVVPLDQAPAMLSRWSANPAAFTKIMVQMYP
jgi:threonine dehydrogenase-like Zn-dependent dehydrogenase